MQKTSIIASTVATMRQASPSSATNRAFTALPVFEAVSGQNGIQLYMASARSPPDAGENCNSCERGRDFGQHEGGEHGNGEAAERRALYVAEQSDAREQPRRPVLLRVGERAKQFVRRDGDTFEVPADR